MAAMNRMSMAQQLNEQIDGESILDGILGEVANAKSAFSGVGADVAAASLAKSKRATDESRAKGLVAKKNASNAVKVAFTNPEASYARDIFSLMKAHEKNNKAELDADREARIIKASSVVPVATNTSTANYKIAKNAIDANNSKVLSEQDRTFLAGEGLKEDDSGNTAAINSALEEAIGTDTPLTQNPDSITTDAERAKDAQSGSGVSINARFPEDKTGTARPPLDLKKESLMSRPRTRPDPSMFFGTERTKIEFGQKALKELGFYANKIDGDAGPQTSSAIKTFQYTNNLPVTGLLDEDTKIKLSSTSGLVSQPKPQTTLLSFISKGEGGYGAVNNDNSAGNVPKANQKFMIDGYYSDTYNKPLTDMTVNEIMNAQMGTTGKTTEELLKMDPESVAAQKKREFFAVGAYQIVPVTMWTAARQGAIDANDIFSSKVQDRIAMEFLAGSDRPKLRDFLAGNPNISVDEAALDLAKQFASVPVTQTQSVAIKIKNKDGSFRTGTKKVLAGTSYYDKVGKNSAQHTAAETKAMLLQARDELALPYYEAR